MFPARARCGRRPGRDRLTLMRAGHNPLKDDAVLFDMYMHALTEVLGKDEIRSALDEVDVSANQMRHMLVSDAGRVLALAPEEFAAYQAARTSAVYDGSVAATAPARATCPAGRPGPGGQQRA
ncbi:hypothetical protein SMD20_45645 [Nonomuraea sp. LP-02]|uniref:hypothetical protein n=1 Tax=Nonomuraea sp. LP-02 TaxID=3097960 RepID=UPI002E31FBD3|nr:hypothetical protein [Nonomuraea sp. LP-02]MED7931572.1 hypothetical protein [Nonomuraea sp. LP-02]